MADDDNSLEIIITLKDNFTRALKSLGGRLKSLLNPVKLISRSIRGLTTALFSLKGAIAGLGAGLLARSFLQAATKTEQLRTRLTVLAGSVREGNKLFKEMADFASTVSFTYDEIMSSATNLTGVLENGSKEVSKWMPIIADLAATSGLGIQETTSQVIRMYSAGAAAADLFRERGILAMLGFQAGVSTSASETRKKLVEAWESPASKFRGAAAALANTWDGMLSMMGDAWFQFRTEVMETGVFSWMKGALSLVLDTVRQLKAEGKFTVLAKEIGDKVVRALELTVKTAALVVDSFRGWQMIWEALKVAFGAFAQVLNRGFQIILIPLEEMVELYGKLLEGIGRAGAALKIMPQGVSDTLKTAGQLLQEIDGISDSAGENAEFWKEIVKESQKELGVLADQESNYVKISGLLDKIRAKAEAYQKASREDDGKSRPSRPQKVAALEQVLKSQTMRLAQTTKTSLAELQNFYDKGVKSLEGYFDERRELIVAQYEKEQEVTNRLLSRMEDPTKRLKLEDQLFARKQEHIRQLMSLDRQQTAEMKKQKQQQLDITRIIGEAKFRAEFDTATNISDLFRKEQADLQQRQRDEIQRLRDMKAKEAEIEEAHRLHQLERDKQSADQRARVQKIVLENLQQSLGFVQEAFTEAYEASGKKVTAFFYVQRAASIAQTLMSTYEAAQQAYKSLVGIPYVGPALATAAAATAVAAGVARVNAIRRQRLASGGEVGGYSPTDTSDNIKADLTAGEYVQPVKTVDYYGVEAMNAIRQRLVPKSILASYRSAGGFRSNRTSFAEGGPVGDIPLTSERENGRQMVIANFYDKEEFARFLATARGQDAIINAIAARRNSVTRLLG